MACTLASTYGNVQTETIYSNPELFPNTHYILEAAESCEYSWVYALHNPANKLFRSTVHLSERKPYAFVNRRPVYACILWVYLILE